MDPGNGNDGPLTVTATFNMHTSPSTKPGRTCADAVIARVTAVASNGVTLQAAPAAGCFAPGDEVLLINQQGRNVSGQKIANVGNHETFHVSTASGTSVVFTTSKTLTYGDLAGSDAFGANEQRVFLQRVPNYTSVTVLGAGTLTGKTWENVGGGGILFFRASGAVDVQGAIRMDGAGYGGGQTAATVPPIQGNQGESRAGRIMSENAALGGRGGGYGGTFCAGLAMPGGGGALGADGTASASTECPQYTSLRYVNFPARLYLGSGGGSGGLMVTADVATTAGGAGGGAVVIHAQAITISGTVSAKGIAGGAGAACVADCTQVSAPGGGGSGGFVFLGSVNGVVGGSRVAVEGGAGAVSCAICVEIGGTGGVGQAILQ